MLEGNEEGHGWQVVRSRSFLEGVCRQARGGVESMHVEMHRMVGDDLSELIEPNIAPASGMHSSFYLLRLIYTEITPCSVSSEIRK